MLHSESERRTGSRWDPDFHRRITQTRRAAERPTITQFISTTGVRLEVALTDFVPRSAQTFFHVEVGGFAVAIKQRRKHKVFIAPGHIQTWIHSSVRSNAPIAFPHPPLHLCDCGGYTKMHRGGRLWPLPRLKVHTNVKPMTSFLLMVAACLNRRKWWQECKKEGRYWVEISSSHC